MDKLRKLMEEYFHSMQVCFQRLGYSAYNEYARALGLRRIDCNGALPGFTGFLYLAQQQVWSLETYTLSHN
jgi:hypothetical protein